MMQTIYFFFYLLMIFFPALCPNHSHQDSSLCYFKIVIILQKKYKVKQASREIIQSNLLL